MPTFQHLSKCQLLAAFAYSAVFPITNLIGGSIMLLGIVITYPFLPLAWVGGMLAVNLASSESAYLIGASATVILQVFLCMLVWSSIKMQRAQTKRS